MGRARRFLAALAVTTAVGAITTTATGRPTLDQRTCGPNARADWLCKEAGVVTIQPPGGRPRSIGARGATRLPRATTVRVRRRSEANVRFGSDASCRLGPSSTQIVTRPLAALFLLHRGMSECRFSSGQRWNFACGTYRRCPVILTTRGRTLAWTHASNPVVIDLCTGGIHVQSRSVNLTFESTEAARYRLELLETDGQVSVNQEIVSEPGVCDDDPSPLP
jgi:hypothetical protein